MLIGDFMNGIICEQCASKTIIPDGYVQPLVKCSSCGALNKTGIEQKKQPTYKILGVNSQVNNQSECPSFGKDKPCLESDETPRLDSSRPTPAIARAPVKAKMPTSVKSTSNIKKEDLPVATRRFMRDALGEQGLQMVFAMVAGYMSEFDDKKKKVKKARVLQTLMKSKITGTLASQALDFAERSPETREIMIQNCKHGIMTGLGVFFAGVIVSLGIHFLANPGRGFVLFQVPFAVGLAYAVYSGVSLVELKSEKLNSSTTHNIVIFVSAFLILLYVVWGVLF
jgi:hypothetical protein